LKRIPARAEPELMHTFALVRHDATVSIRIGDGSA
jgi:hypothetical protein